MKMPSDQTKVSAMLMGLILNQAAELDALRTFVAYLAQEQGISPEHFSTVIQTNSKKAAEDLLLAWGDKSPEFAELADIYGILRDRKEGERE